MLYMVQMAVKKPHDIDSDIWTDIITREREYGQTYMKNGQFPHIWRVVGKFANVSIFDVESNDVLHQILAGFPLFPYMDIQVTALAEHPSALKK
ncbi:muconolactone Delta-isomerase family protein [Acinetobacter pragensis]|uniref:Muconolactone Delta-isomerase n=1 Tax=Acinetobacter pragensis TaxID=1806892 RepID=A0A151Y3S4_9GAMM|nr:muconolactone Delta-isomerase family protein [Acinetobacter pragensis]KYQ72668.1 muconolactone delta-isomerase [Acinetobacter pragensis]